MGLGREPTSEKRASNCIMGDVVLLRQKAESCVVQTESQQN